MYVHRIYVYDHRHVYIYIYIHIYTRIHMVWFVYLCLFAYQLGEHVFFSEEQSIYYFEQTNLYLMVFDQVELPFSSGYGQIVKPAVAGYI